MCCWPMQSFKARCGSRRWHVSARCLQRSPTLPPVPPVNSLVASKQGRKSVRVIYISTYMCLDWCAANETTAVQAYSLRSCPAFDIGCNACTYCICFSRRKGTLHVHAKLPIAIITASRRGCNTIVNNNRVLSQKLDPPIRHHLTLQKSSPV